MRVDADSGAQPHHPVNFYRVQYLDVKLIDALLRQLYFLLPAPQSGKKKVVPAAELENRLVALLVTETLPATLNGVHPAYSKQDLNNAVSTQNEAMIAQIEEFWRPAVANIIKILDHIGILFLTRDGYRLGFRYHAHERTEVIAAMRLDEQGNVFTPVEPTKRRNGRVVTNLRVSTHTPASP